MQDLEWQKERKKETKIARHCVNAFRVLILTIMGCSYYCVFFKDKNKGSERVNEPPN